MAYAHLYNSYDDHYVPSGCYNISSKTIKHNQHFLKKSSDYDSDNDNDFYDNGDNYKKTNKKLRVSEYDDDFEKFIDEFQTNKVNNENIKAKWDQNEEETVKIWDRNEVFQPKLILGTDESLNSSKEWKIIEKSNKTIQNRRNNSLSSTNGLSTTTLNTSVNSIQESSINNTSAPNSPHFITHSLSLKRGCDDDLNSTRSSKKSKSIVTLREMKEFFHLLDDETIKEFLKRDKCCMVSDKYALAMVFTYFKRAKLELNEFTKLNFFLALYLANDIEEDTDEFKYEIFPWALGSSWRSTFHNFLKKRDNLLKNIDYRAIVSRKCCDEVMSLVSDHSAWKRNRPLNHGGAIRSYLIRRLDESKENAEFIENGVNLPRGPFKRPRPCPICEINRTNPYL